MVEGYCYAVPNEYILRKLIKYIRSKKINYSVFDYYVIAEKPVDFENFRFKISKYYVQRLGGKDKSNNYKKVKIDRWKNDLYAPKSIFNREICKYDFKLKKVKGKVTKGGREYPSHFCLYIKNKKYKFNYNLHLLPYFVKREEKEFFERDYDLFYLADEKIENDKRFSEMENKYLNDMDENGIFLPSNKVPKQYEGSYIYDRRFLFSVFYNYYFKHLTLNQQKVCALLLLGIKVTDIARLLNTTQVYVTLEIRRLSKKIRKIYNKIQKEFWE